MTFWRRLERSKYFGRQPAQYPIPREAPQRGGEVEDFVFGNVWTRIWRNRDRKGRIYFKVSFDRLEQKFDRSKLSKSFYVSDLDDLYLALCRTREYFEKDK